MASKKKPKFKVDDWVLFEIDNCNMDNYALVRQIRTVHTHDDLDDGFTVEYSLWDYDDIISESQINSKMEKTK